ncbi:MAG: dephospho-CoA kinase [Xanthomonadaceae bacterium]|nr:dephospho-CoA kinase [Xanthomonadaceae bacterium]
MTGFVVAVTGGVASGKSEVTRRFERLGVPVFDADIAAREALAPGSPGLAAVVHSFGLGVLAPDGGLDRRAMRQRVFNDDTARRQLETIVHPIVRERLRAQVEQCTADYAILAIPLLAESGGRERWPFIDRVLLVDVPESVQMSRLMARDGIDRPLATSMIAAQSTRAQRLALADDVVVNDGPLHLLDEAVASLHHRYTATAEARRRS